MKTYNTTPAKKFFLSSFLFVLSLFMIQSCDDDDGPTNPPGETGNIVEVAQSDDNFSTLVSAVSDAGLADDLQGNGPFTVFAPTNDAFNALPDGLLASLTNEQLVEILSYHVIAGAEVVSGDLQAEQAVESLSGDSLYITVEGGEVEVNDGADVENADIEASNGIIHAIDQVVLPDKFLNLPGIIDKRYSLQVVDEAIEEAGLVSTLQGDGPFTVFAPNNASFEGIDLSGLSQEQLQGILTYHVLPAKVLSGDLESSQTVTTVNGAELEINVTSDSGVTLTDQQGSTYRVIQADLEGANGVVHVINGVLMPE